MAGIALSGILIALSLYVASLYVLLPFLAAQYTRDVITFLQRRPSLLAQIFILVALELAAGITALFWQGRPADILAFVYLMASTIIGIVPIPFLWLRTSDPYTLASWLVRAKQTDKLTALLSRALDADDFSQAKALLSAVQDHLIKTTRWTERDGILLSETGHTLWHRGEPPGIDLRTSRHTNQLDDIRQIFIGNTKLIWFEIVLRHGKEAANIFCVALTGFVRHLSDDGFVSRMEDVLDSEKEHHLLSPQTFLEFAAALGNFRRSLPAETANDGSTHDWLDSLAMETALLYARQARQGGGRRLRRELAEAGVFKHNTKRFEIMTDPQIPTHCYTALEEAFAAQGCSLMIHDALEPINLPLPPSQQ